MNQGMATTLMSRSLPVGKSMRCFSIMLEVTCPSCFETFEVIEPPLEETPCEVDYDCEVCCRPMLICFSEMDGEVWADARGLGD